MTLNDSLEKNIPLDNRKEDPKDITDEYYHEKYNTISCPHCGCTLSPFAVMAGHYCYVCGGKFGERNLQSDKSDEYEVEEEC